MAVGSTTRLELTTWSDSNDEFSRQQMSDSHTALGANAAIFLAGSGTPPTVNTSNTKAFYWDTANDKLYFRGTVDSSTAAHAWTQAYPATINLTSSKLYQYGNITSGGTDTSGAILPGETSRSTPRIYVQSNDPSAATGYVGITGDIWFQI